MTYMQGNFSGLRGISQGLRGIFHRLQGEFPSCSGRFQPFSGRKFHFLIGLRLDAGTPSRFARVQVQVQVQVRLWARKSKAHKKTAH
jgi:hypothetical protein